MLEVTRARLRQQLGAKKQPVIRFLMVVAGIAAIGFGCLILVWPAPFASTSKSTKTTVEPMKTTTVTTQTTSSPSNALVGGVFGVGVLLLLAAIWFDRLQELKVPGGSIVLAPPTPSEETREEIAAGVTEGLRKQTGEDPSAEDAAMAAADAMAAAQDRLAWHAAAQNQLAWHAVVAKNLKAAQQLTTSSRIVGPDVQVVQASGTPSLSKEEIREAVDGAIRRATEETNKRAAERAEAEKWRFSSGKDD